MKEIKSLPVILAEPAQHTPGQTLKQTPGDLLFSRMCCNCITSETRKMAGFLFSEQKDFL